MQSVLVSPLPSWAMVLGKILGGSVIATGQGLIFLLLGLTIPVNTNPLSLAALVLLLWIASLALTSLGFVIAWRMESTQGFHAIMNLALMPMWLLSGAFFPVPRTSDGSWSGPVLHWIMRLNPVTYVVSGARQLLFDTPPAAGLWSPSLTTCWVVSLLFAALLTGAAWKVSEQRVTGDLL